MRINSTLVLHDGGLLCLRDGQERQVAIRFFSKAQSEEIIAREVDAEDPVVAPLRADIGSSPMPDTADRPMTRIEGAAAVTINGMRCKIESPRVIELIDGVVLPEGPSVIHWLVPDKPGVSDGILCLYDKPFRHMVVVVYAQDHVKRILAGLNGYPEENRRAIMRMVRESALPAYARREAIILDGEVAEALNFGWGAEKRARKEN